MYPRYEGERATGAHANEQHCVPRNRFFRAMKLASSRFFFFFQENTRGKSRLSERIIVNIRRVVGH